MAKAMSHLDRGQMIADAVADHFDRFGVHFHLSNVSERYVFQVSAAKSFVDDNGCVVLVVQRLDDDGCTWLDYSKGTPSALGRICKPLTKR